MLDKNGSIMQALVKVAEVYGIDYIEKHKNAPCCYSEHEDGTILIMQRDPAKEYGGLWEATAGGSALKGESPLECAQRELYEETGIRGRDFREYKRGQSLGPHCFYTEFTALTDCDKTSVRMQENETVAFRWVTKEELKELKDAGQLTERSCGCVSEILHE